MLFPAAAVESDELSAGSAEGAMLASMQDLSSATGAHQKRQRDEEFLEAGEE
jgi:hypothetical protein